MRASALLLVATLAGCLAERPPGDWEAWYDPGSGVEVEEPIAFTESPYDFPGPGEAGIADVWDLAHGLPGFPSADTGFAPSDPPPSDCNAYTTLDALPLEIEGMVTLHPRMYFKVDGCVPPNSNVDSEEKFYGSYFVEDSTGGVFVLGDSKVAHFDMGDRVRMRVRAVRDRFDLVSVAAHDILEVDRGPYPIYYQMVEGRLGDDDVGRVRRVVGEVITDPDTFGAFKVRDDDGFEHDVTLDTEINRRGVRYPVGSRIEATGPVMFSFDVYAVVILRVGQVTVLADTAGGPAPTR